MTTQENCSAGHCTPVGLDLTVPTIPPAPEYLGGYEGVYSPTGGFIAYVRNAHGRPVIYTAGPFAGPGRLTGGSEPDWQPTHQAKGGA
jgi:hypothetical protein